MTIFFGQSNGVRPTLLLASNKTGQKEIVLMSIDERSKAEVDQRLRRLRKEFGSITVEETTVTNTPEFFEHGRELVEKGWIGDAGAWVTDDECRGLLIRHAGDPDRWGTPGGGHEPGEGLKETARREVREETGVECTITGVYWARHKTVVLEPDPDQRFHMLTVEFEADYEEGEIKIGDDEIIEAKWFSEPPNTVAGFLEDQVRAWNSQRKK